MKPPPQVTTQIEKKRLNKKVNDLDRKLFIRRLPSSLKQEQFSYFFSKYGRVVSSEIILDLKTGKSRGYGFIIFDSSESLIRVMEESENIWLKGKQIQCSIADEKHQPLQQKKTLSEFEIHKPNKNHYHDELIPNQILEQENQYFEENRDANLSKYKKQWYDCHQIKPLKIKNNYLSKHYREEEEEDKYIEDINFNNKPQNYLQKNNNMIKNPRLKYKSKKTSSSIIQNNNLHWTGFNNPHLNPVFKQKTIKNRDQLQTPGIEKYRYSDGIKLLQNKDHYKTTETNLQQIKERYGNKNNFQRQNLFHDEVTALKDQSSCPIRSFVNQKIALNSKNNYITDLNGSTNIPIKYSASQEQQRYRISCGLND